MTAFALRPEDFYHTGIIVPDLEVAMARLSALAGYRRITPVSYTLPFRTVSGTREVTATFVYSLQVPHVELIQEVPGTAWVAAPATRSITSATGATIWRRAHSCWKTTVLRSKRLPTPPPQIWRCSPTTSMLRAPASRSSTAPCFPISPPSCSPPPRRKHSEAVPGMLLTVLRFNFASPQGDPRTQSRLMSAALELEQWGESHGITAVSVGEHHATGHGWSCNPIMAAAMFLTRTSTLIASVDCALRPLWNPVRLAEDIALVDNVSRGRLHTTVGLGYRSVEYDALRADFGRRGALMDSGCWPSGPAVAGRRESAPAPGPGRIHRCTSAGARGPRRVAQPGSGCRSASPITSLTSPTTTANCAPRSTWPQWFSCRDRSTGA